MTTFRRLLGLPTLAAAFTACAQAPAPASLAPASPDTVYVVDTVRVTTEAAADAALEARVARLEIMLLERDARLAAMQESLDASRQEVVRNLAKLQSQATRAEAASGLAEAEIAVQTLSRVSGGRALAEYGQAQARIEEASAEFAADNFEGALYLATEARTLARTAQARLSRSSDVELRAGETLFSTSVPLQNAAQRVNVRRGPGLNFPVLFTLDPSTALTGQSYTNEWVRVTDAEGREGWIFHTLVTAQGG